LRELKNTSSMLALFATIPAGPSSTPRRQVNNYLLPSGLDFISGTLPAEAKGRTLFMSNPGIWDSEPVHNGREPVILLSPCPWQEVAMFAESSTKDRTPAYHEKKEALTQQMMATARQTWENCGDIMPLAAGTPLTFRDELSTPQGAAYGAMHCLGQYTPECRTRVPGLLLAGQSTLMTGVVGASLSGMVSAGEITGLEQLWNEVRLCR
jgi:all-trans-retinol 13,14-reductase